MLQDDPLRYLLRALGAGMGLTLVVFVYWILKQNLHDISIGAVIHRLFRRRPGNHHFTDTELFTSNNMYLPYPPSKSRQLGTSRAALDFLLLRQPCWCDPPNDAAGRRWSLGQLPSDHALFSGALQKAHQVGSVIFFKGILANWIVCLAVRIALRCKEEIAKIATLLLITFIFVYLGFEHSIANMGTFAMAILGGGTVIVGDALHNLLYSTAGNVVGGVLLVGFPFTYLNRREREEQIVRIG